MPVSKFYKPVGNVKVPDPNDPVDMSVSPGMTSYQFGAPDVYAAQRGGMRPVTQREIGADALQRAMMGIPDLPSDLSTGSLEMMRRSIPQMPAPLKAKPAENYGTNRGGTGSAGRKTTAPQFGGSQFDVGPQFMPPESDMSIADLRKLDDKPWELDENTNADVAAGTSFEPQKDNITDRQPDLNSPAGLYEALSKRYPDILQKNLETMEQGRVSLEDVDALRDRAGLGSLFIAASKAASAAGSVGGKQPESIAEKIVTREDTLARQNLKDRLDVSSENMAQTAKALDLAVKQINFADEREQYDPNSEVSKFARDFMRSEFELNIPDNVPAYQLKQFLPAMVQKYSADERARYQAALLGYKETPEQAATRRATEAKAERDFKAGESELDRKLRKDLADARAKKAGAGGAKVLTGTNIPKDIADKEFKMAEDFKTEKPVLKYKIGAIALQEMRELKGRQDPYGDQGLINGYAKILDPESVVRGEEYKVVERGGGLLDSIKNRFDILAGKARLQPAQREMLLQAAEALQRGRQTEYDRTRKQYEERAKLYGLEPQRVFGSEPTSTTTAAPTGGMSPERKAKLEELRRKKGQK